MKMEHIITLQSNVTLQNSSNTIASFITPLSQRLNLDGSWVVGISEIQYKKSWYNILEPTKIKLFAKFSFMNELTDFQTAYNNYIPEGHYESEEQLIDTLNTELKNIKDIKPPTIEYNKLSKKVKIIPGLVNKDMKLFPSFGDEIDNLIGIKSELTGSYAYSTETLEIEPFHPVDISRGYHSLYVYSNIVYPSHIGDTFSHILRVVEVPNEKKFGDDIVIRYENPQYRTVLFDEITNIEINIKDDTNELIPFKFGRVRIDLHFKKL